MKTEKEIAALAKNHFHSGNDEKELAIARIGFIEGYKAAQHEKEDGLKNAMLIIHRMTKLSERNIALLSGNDLGLLAVAKKMVIDSFNIQDVMRDIPSPPQQ